MALSDAIKVRIRRHLGYPVIGQYRVGPGGATLAQGTVGYRYFQAAGALEYRMNNMLPSEEAVIVGRALGAVGVVGGNPMEGDTFSLTISADFLTTPQVVTVTADAGDQPVNIAIKLAFAVNNNQAMQLAGFSAMAPYGQGPYSYNAVPLPECSVLNDQPFLFSLSFASTGGCGLSLLANGQLQPPFTTINGRDTIYGWVPILDNLEGAWIGSSQNMDTKKADVWESRGSEARNRLSLYKQYLDEFGNFLGIPVSREKPQNVRNNTPLRYN